MYISYFNKMNWIILGKHCTGKNPVYCCLCEAPRNIPQGQILLNVVLEARDNTALVKIICNVLDS